MAGSVALPPIYHRHLDMLVKLTRLSVYFFWGPGQRQWKEMLTQMQPVATAKKELPERD